MAAFTTAGIFLITDGVKACFWKQKQMILLQMVVGESEEGKFKQILQNVSENEKGKRDEDSTASDSREESMKR